MATCASARLRSDDLISCETDYLRQLVLALKQRLESDPTGQMTALIHCAGMPLVSVGVVAVLCDVCEFDLPDTSTYAARSARDEAARLMAHLPASCRVLPHAPPDSDHLAGGDPEKGGKKHAS